MAIVIKSIINEEKDYVVARVTHGSSSLELRVEGKKSALEAFIEKELTGELSYSTVISARVLDSFHDDESGLFESNKSDDEHIVLGRIHSITQVNEQESLVDLYLQTGPEFLIVSSKSFSGIPEEGKGVKLILRGLCFHPGYASQEDM